ncbi:hypothetical protein [Stakelama tenebrarum]|uniref:Uncharacterized protein n=1 Tax=Stakelama tenebrarum TaxID=2711215 RepID=A0A6G6Y5A8_9SPHN|nr:hypothetical protein [Sphingosinithalassobacter tenebrarum]QIG80090.1 hypothetical protein G5C33_10065 [Sphingosinithalassobacter tenebrarum]
MTYLNHLTLNTGHLRRSYRSEVNPSALAHTRDLLADAIEAGGDIAMPVDRYRLHVEPFGSRRAALCTVSRAAAPIMSMGVAARPARALWGQLIAMRHRLQLDGPELAEPDAPWCAALLLPPSDDDHGAMAWLGDLERCAAWAWIEGAA